MKRNEDALHTPLNAIGRGQHLKIDPDNSERYTKQIRKNFTIRFDKPARFQDLYHYTLDRKI